MEPRRVPLAVPSPSNLEESFWTTNFIDPITSLSPTRLALLLFCAALFIVANAAFFRLTSIISRDSTARRPPASPEHPTHILIVLGSGGHTAEMFNILSQAPCLQLDFTHRTYVVSSGDDFSASRAHEFEKTLLADLESAQIPIPQGTGSNYDVLTVHRARRVHQGFLTAPVSSLKCLLDCIAVLKGTHRDVNSQRRTASNIYPDLILTNGPGTGVIIVLASIILLFFGYGGPSPSTRPSSSSSASKRGAPSDVDRYRGQMRSIFIESWARVKTLSLSGRLLKPLVNRFIVQWPDLVKQEGGRVEYIGPLVT